MLQNILLYIILFASVAYIAYRFYSGIEKKEACDKCELMKAAKGVGEKK